jgi:hypothetical protein
MPGSAAGAMQTSPRGQSVLSVHALPPVSAVPVDPSLPVAVASVESSVPAVVSVPLMLLVDGPLSLSVSGTHVPASHSSRGSHCGVVSRHAQPSLPGVHPPVLVPLLVVASEPSFASSLAHALAVHTIAQRNVQTIGLAQAMPHSIQHDRTSRRSSCSGCLSHISLDLHAPPLVHAQPS